MIVSKKQDVLRARLLSLKCYAVGSERGFFYVLNRIKAFLWHGKLIGDNDFSCFKSGFGKMLVV